MKMNLKLKALSISIIEKYDALIKTTQLYTCNRLENKALIC